MSHLVLYRKYRPQTFAEIVGQEHIVQTLLTAIERGMISHAYLFSGPRGTGKTTIARLLAKSLNCENKDNLQYWAERKIEESGSKGGWGSTKKEPICNECSSCKEIMEGRSMDLIEIDAASNRGIDEMRELREGARFAPSKSRYKVFIIDEAHQLTKEASNALLKTLEEPPSHVIFILATTELHKMLATIVSRCQRYDFRKLTMPELIGRLEILSKAENVKIEKDALELIAANASGASRDAESLLSQVLTVAATSQKETIKAENVRELLGIVNSRIVSQLIDFLGEKKTAQALDFLGKTLEKGCDPAQLSKALLNYLRQALVMKISPSSINPDTSGLTKEEDEKLQSQIKLFEEKDITRILKLFLEADNKIKYSPIPQLPLELAIVEAGTSKAE